MSEEKIQKMEVSIDHSEPGFFSDGVTVSHNPNKFVIDFTQTIPRFDSIGPTRKQSLTIKHKTIIIDPIVAKDFLNVLRDNLKKYEKNIGKIEVRRIKKQKVVVSKAKDDDARRYIG